MGGTLAREILTLPGFDCSLPCKLHFLIAVRSPSRTVPGLGSAGNIPYLAVVRND